MAVSTFGGLIERFTATTPSDTELQHLYRRRELHTHQTKEYGCPESFPTGMHKKLNGGHRFQCSLFLTWMIFAPLCIANAVGLARASETAQAPARTSSLTLCTMKLLQQGLPTQVTTIQGLAPPIDSEGKTTRTAPTVYIFSLNSGVNASSPSPSTHTAIETDVEVVTEISTLHKTTTVTVTPFADSTGLGDTTTIRLYTTAIVTVTLPTSSSETSFPVSPSSFSDGLSIVFSPSYSSFSQPTSIIETVKPITIDIASSVTPALNDRTDDLRGSPLT